MRILLLTNLFDQEEKIYIKNSKIALQNQSSKFCWNIVEGIEENLPNQTDVINVLPIGPFPSSYKKLFIKKNQWKHSASSNNISLGCLNIASIKRWQFKRKLSCLIKKWEKQYIDQDTYIIATNVYLPFLQAIVKAAEKSKTTLVVPDLPDFNYSIKENCFLKHIKQRRSKLFYKAVNKFDNYVLLTEHMKEKLDTGNKPYTVIEGFYKKIEIIPCKSAEYSDKKIILYAGSYKLMFGIENLLKAFNLLKGDQYVLWVCGKGEADNLISDFQKKDQRIVNFGYVSSAEILKLQQQCTVLVNPRNDSGEYTKYSFPSKTMEYLASGKPVVGYQLEGIPKDYFNFLISPKDNEIESLKETLEKVCNFDEETRLQIGNHGKEFITENKNNRVQGKKLLNLVLGSIAEAENDR